MSWNLKAEERIGNALESGEIEFPEELRGKPLDLSDYFNTPEDLRMGYSVLKSGGYVPLQVDLLREINALETAADNEDNLRRRAALRQRVTELRLRLDLKPAADP